MRRSIPVVLLFCFAFAIMLVPAAQAAQQPFLQLFLDGKRLSPTVPPKLVNNTTMVPARIIAEALGADVEWTASTRNVVIARRDTVITLTVNRTVAIVNGKTVKLDLAPMLENGSTLLPIRFIAENLGILVRWDKPTSSISLWTTDSQVSGSDPATDPDVPSIPGGDYPVLNEIYYVNNQLVVKSNGSFTPNVAKLSNPDRLVIDIPGMRFGGGSVPAPTGEETGYWNGVDASNPLLSAVRYSMYDPATSTIRIVADLKQPADYQVVNGGDRNSLIVHLSTVSSEKPKGSSVLIYHSHIRESFLSLLPGVTNPSSAYDATRNVAYLGDRFAQNLRASGAEVFHAKDDYQSMYGSSFSFGKSYTYSEKTVAREMSQHPQIRYVFDLHRDSSPRSATTVNIGGTSYAKLYFVIGLENPDWKLNDAFAKKIQSLINAKYPGLSRGIYYKDHSVGNGWYNQNLSPRSALIEVGGVYNTLTETYRTIDILSDAIKELRQIGY